MRIFLFIRSLGLGGAERQLLTLAEGLSIHHDVTVLTFYDDLEYKFYNVKNRKYRYINLKKKGRWDIFVFAWRFLSEVRCLDPHVIYAFMNTASIFSLLSRLVSSRIKIIWGIRSSNMKLENYGFIQKFLRLIECKVSVFSDLVISNSYEGKIQAKRDGYKARNFKVIPNGIDVGLFNFCSEHRKELRSTYNIKQNVFVIGCVARHDPMKGLEQFLEAIKIHLNSFPETIFIQIGSGDKSYSVHLTEMAKNLGINKSILWVGKCINSAPYYSVMDLFASSSIYGEGFSNSIAEAMSSKVPVVVTNVGDAKRVVGEIGIIVRPNDPDALAREWGRVQCQKQELRKQIGIQSRNWIEGQFSPERMVKRTEVCVESILHQ